MNSSPVLHSEESRRSRLGLAEFVALAGLALVLVAVQARNQFLDPDMFHELAVARVALEQGSVPMRDLFAFTPTIHPSIHHEWGTGVVLYLTAMWQGLDGLIALRFGLVVLMSLISLWCVRKAGASWPVVVFVAPLAMILGEVGLTTVRAQVFTMCFVSALLTMLEFDRQGRRWWIPIWLVMYVLWLNLHAGFVVGVMIFGAHWIEQVWRTRTPQWHLVLTGAAMAGLTFVNPYGWHYPAFVWHSLGLDRPSINEWKPLWSARGAEVLLPLYVFSILIIVYAGFRAGWRRLTGLLIVALCAYAALRHVRHTSIYAIAWFCIVPAWLRLTPLDSVLERLWRRGRWVVAGVALAGGAACIGLLAESPWAVHIPVTPKDEVKYKMAYPVGPVEYLRQIDFRGTLMSPFTSGAYLSWELHPKLGVRVGMDGRYEVAYQDGVVEELIEMYWGADGWKQTLERYPTDVLLVSRTSPLAKLMSDQADWTRTYRDDAFDLYTRPGLSLPSVDRSGQPVNAPSSEDLFRNSRDS